MTEPSENPADEPSDDAESPSATPLATKVGRARSEVSERAGRALSWVEETRDRNTLLDIAMRLHARDGESAGTVASSAVAFRMFLFFVPTLLVVVALAGFLAAHVSSRDVADGAGVTGSLAEQIDTALSQKSSTRWAALLTGLFGMVSAGRSLAKSLVLSYSLSWRVPPKEHKATVKVTTLVVGVVLAIAICTVLVNRLRQSYGLAVGGASFIGVVVVYMLAWLALSLVLPRATHDPSALLPGSTLVGLALAGLQAVTQLYIPGRISRASALYGSLGITVVTLGWFFIVGRVVVFSATVNAVVYERLGSIGAFVFGLPVLRILPDRSPRFARFFGLDDEPPSSGVSSGAADG